VEPSRQLPQLEGGLFLTDGGLETVLIFHRGWELPEFAAFPLLEDEVGIAALRDYYRPYLELARDRGAGFVLESPTWRANPDWARRLGYGPDELARANRRAIGLMQELREEFAPGVAPIVISGCIGPQSDGYSPTTHLDAEAAREYHAAQIAAFAEAAADLVTVMTMTYAEEAVGVALAARDLAMPAVISFTVETDGRLPSGQSLGAAIEQVDALSGGSPAYYMVNCAHPTHFEGVLDGPWCERIGALRANASTMSHAELDEAEKLDEGDPDDLAARYAALRGRLPQLRVLGGCCGTDHRHVAAISREWPA
jgi:S-methylmethionine-dependent homocysteine/selenocysteine methylase